MSRKMTTRRKEKQLAHNLCRGVKKARRKTMRELREGKFIVLDKAGFEKRYMGT